MRTLGFARRFENIPPNPQAVNPHDLGISKTAADPRAGMNTDAWIHAAGSFDPSRLNTPSNWGHRVDMNLPNLNSDRTIKQVNAWVQSLSKPSTGQRAPMYNQAY